MGLLHKSPDPEGMGQPLGYRPIGSFIDTQNRLVAGGERPVFNDTSRPGNEAPGASLITWKRKQPATTNQKTKTPEEIQGSYDKLFE